MTWFATSKLGRALALIGASILAILTFGASQRRQGRELSETEALREDERKLEDGRKAVQSLRDAGRNDLVDRLQDNDDKWRGV